MTTSPKIRTWKGADVDVTYDARLCLHVGECGRADNALFVGGRQSWCDPDAVDVDVVMDTINRCPTGALTAHRHDGGPDEAPAASNTVHIANNGPLYIRGDLRIGDDDAPRHRVALCRCGASKNKPYCDNSHERDAFIDRGAIGEIGDPGDLDGGALTITPAPDGPLLLRGPVTLVASSGRCAWRGNKTALCRCGASKNKPFCDGSHRVIGFRSTNE